MREFRLVEREGRARDREIRVELDALDRVPFMRGLNDGQRRELVGRARRRSLEAGRVVFSHGDEPDGMYILLAGRVRVFTPGSDGQRLELATYEPGGFFGELALLEGRPRSATAETLEPCEFLVLGREDFLGLLEHGSARVTAEVLAALSRMIRDAKERLWAQELARQRLRVEAEVERHRALAQLVAGVAHELNTPLGIANTAADLIENRSRRQLAERLGADAALRPVLDDVLEASELMRRSLRRAHALVQTFKQMSVHQLLDGREPVDVGELVGEVVDLFKLQARRGNLAVRVDDRRADRERACTDVPSALTQVLLNLLTNVERYAYPDGRGGALEVVLESADVAGRPGVALTVRDFGCGIPPEHLQKVFEPFFTTGRDRGGTGLGLAITYNAVTSALGGRIRIDSEPGRGTAVTVELPTTGRADMA